VTPAGGVKGIKMRWKSPQSLQQQQQPWRGNSQIQVTVISRCKNPFLTSSNLMYLKAGFVCFRQDEVTTRLSLGELFRLECGTVKQT
jgi:hypothetical protein